MKEARQSRVSPQGRVHLSEDDNNGLDQDFLGEAIELDSDIHGPFSQGSTGSRPYRLGIDAAFLKKDTSCSKRNSLLATDINAKSRGSSSSVKKLSGDTGSIP